MINETNKATGQECAVAGPLVGRALSPHRGAHSRSLGRDRGAMPRLSSRGRASRSLAAPAPAPRPSLLCAGAAGCGCHGDGALPARAPPQAARLRAPRQVRAGRCGAASHCGRCAEGAGARGRARGRAETHGDAHSCPRGRVESWQSWRRAKQGAGRSRVPGPAADLGGIPLHLRPGNAGGGRLGLAPFSPTRVRGSRVPRDRAVQARADLPLAGKRWPFCFRREGRRLLQRAVPGGPAAGAGACVLPRGRALRGGARTARSAVTKMCNLDFLPLGRVAAPGRAQRGAGAG